MRHLIYTLYGVIAFFLIGLIVLGIGTLANSPTGRPILLVLSIGFSAWLMGLAMKETL